MSTTTTTCRSVIVASHKARTAHGLTLAIAVSIIAARAIAKYAKEVFALVAYCIGEGKRIADQKRKEG